MPEGHTLFRLAREQSVLFAGRPVHVTSPQGRFEAGAALLDGRVLDAARERGLHVLPYCSFVRHYILQHPETADLVAAEDRGRFGLEPAPR